MEHSVENFTHFLQFHPTEKTIKNMNSFIYCLKTLHSTTVTTYNFFSSFFKGLYINQNRGKMWYKLFKHKFPNKFLLHRNRKSFFFNQLVNLSTPSKFFLINILKYLKNLPFLRRFCSAISPSFLSPWEPLPNNAIISVVSYKNKKEILTKRNINQD